MYSIVFRHLETSLTIQVAERALYFWSNDHILQLIQEFSGESVPILFPALSRNIRAHWNHNIYNLILSALKVVS